MVERGLSGIAIKCQSSNSYSPYFFGLGTSMSIYVKLRRPGTYSEEIVYIGRTSEEIQASVHKCSPSVPGPHRTIEKYHTV